MEEENRSVQDVQKIMGHAKLEQQDLKDTVQCLHFVTDLDNARLKLMEIDDDILETLQQGDRLTVRGGKSDLAMLCTNTKTYQLREQETSNCLLLLPECTLPEKLNNSTAETTPSIVHRHICAMKYDYFELTPIRPKLKRLKELLENCLYNGEEEEGENQGEKKYRYSDLLEEIQASEAEILAGLRELQACQINGYMRVLSFDFLSKVMGHIVQLIDEQTWSLDAVPVKECCDTLQELFKRKIVSHVLQCFSENADDKFSSEDPEFTVKLHEDKVCRVFAEMILRPLVGFKLDEFEKVWQQSVPEGFNTALYQLEGLALIDRDSSPVTIKYFPVIELPEGVNERFNKLFTTKEKWTMEEITPYIKDVATGGLSVGALLTKYARASTVNGVKMFNSKRPLR